MGNQWSQQFHVLLSLVGRLLSLYGKGPEVRNVLTTMQRLESPGVYYVGFNDDPVEMFTKPVCPNLLDDLSESEFFLMKFIQKSIFPCLKVSLWWTQRISLVPKFHRHTQLVGCSESPHICCNIWMHRIHPPMMTVQHHTMIQRGSSI